MCRPPLQPCHNYTEMCHFHHNGPNNTLICPSPSKDDSLHTMHWSLQDHGHNRRISIRTMAAGRSLRARGNNIRLQHTPRRQALASGSCPASADSSQALLARHQSSDRDRQTWAAPDRRHHPQPSTRNHSWAVVSGCLGKRPSRLGRRRRPPRRLPLDSLKRARLIDGEAHRAGLRLTMQPPIPQKERLINGAPTKAQLTCMLLPQSLNEASQPKLTVTSRSGRPCSQSCPA